MPYLELIRRTQHQQLYRIPLDPSDARNRNRPSELQVRRHDYPNPLVHNPFYFELGIENQVQGLGLLFTTVAGIVICIFSEYASINQLLTVFTHCLY